MAADKKPPPILVPIDFSMHSRAALESALELATLLDAPVVVLHVVHDPSDAPGFYAPKDVKQGKKGLKRIQDVAADMMKSFMRDFAKHHGKARTKRIETMLRSGLPVTQILAVVDEIRPQMVVMGSLGRTGLKHVLLGSKAEQIARLCPVPVTIVKNNPEERARK